ncbi:MAG: DNA repair exonuclease, partial [Desulfurobacteriaceae bacterium]
MRIAHLSDSHLGFAQYQLLERRADFLKAFKKAIDDAVDREVDLIVHSGDLFETYHPDMATLSETIKILQKVREAGIPFIAITGNHDRTLRKGIVPPHKILKDLGLLTLIDPYGETEVKGVYIAGFRYYSRHYMSELKSDLFEQFSKRAEKSGASILIFHQGIDQFIDYEGAYELLISELPENFSYYAAGHIHAFLVQEVKGGILSYPGATEFRSKAEARRGRRGFNIFDLEKKQLERVELEGLRPFIVEKFSEEEAEEKLKDIAQELENCKDKAVVIIDYSYKQTELEVFSDLLNRIKRNALVLRV